MSCPSCNPIVRFLVSIFAPPAPPAPSAPPDPSATTTTTNDLGKDCVGAGGFSICYGFT
jgi:hypothetical protein